MYVYESKPAPEHQPPSTLPELLGYLRRLFSSIDRDHIGYRSTHTTSEQTQNLSLMMVCYQNKEKK